MWRSLWGLALAGSLAAERFEGRVTDARGSAVAGAAVAARAASGVTLAHTESGADGAFAFDLPAGAASLRIEAPGFSPRELPLAGAPAAITLGVAPLFSSITVTARRGEPEDPRASAAVAAAIDRDAFGARPANTIGNLLENQPGILVQQTTPGQVSPFLRGLTGYQVLNLVDGVRFNNATFRSGPNQYLAFLEPSQAQRLEAVLGPAGAQYGSDALGGTIQVRTQEPRPGRLHGELALSGASADLSGGASAELTGGTDRFGWLAGAVGRRVNDLRAGGGVDSRNIFTRYFGLSPARAARLLGDRAQDTAFSQYGFHGKANFRPTDLQSVSLWYQFSQIDGLRNYKDLNGGLGRLLAAVEPQRLNFFYARYERFALGPFDSISGTFSLNSQADGSGRQALRFSDPVTVDRTRVDAYGYTGQAALRAPGRQTVLFGGEFFDERIFASRLTGGRPQRPLFPDGSRYRTWAVFGQDSASWFSGRLRASAGGRFTGVNYGTVADPALGVPRSAQDFRDATFHASLSWNVAGPLALHARAGRGFRAPNANDLGAVGLNDLGYEIPSADAIPAGALLSTNAGEGALSSGRKLTALAPERLFSYETGAVVRTAKLYARAQIFLSELYDPIVRRTLLFPASSIPQSLGGIAVRPLPPTPQQAAQGVVTVATAFDPRAVKAFVNDGRSRYYGIESTLDYQFDSRWSVQSNYTFLIGRDLNPNRNIRRLPPQQGFVQLRYTPARRWWITGSLTLTGAQERLSGGDLDDERIGASRSRNDIAAFFAGARAQAFIDARGVFLPTGETLAQIQNRVLPGVASATQRVPLYPRTAGWVAADLAGGYRLGERWTLNLAVSNLLDRNYRVHGSGFDAPGVNAFAALRYRF
jgi:outer membrane receptor protein involved in Fe transport